MQTSDADRIMSICSHPQLIAEALTQAVQQAMWRHKRLGESIVVWDDGKVRTIPAEEIQLDPTVIDLETGKLR